MRYCVATVSNQKLREVCVYVSAVFKQASSIPTSLRVEIIKLFDIFAGYGKALDHDMMPILSDHLLIPQFEIPS